MASKTVLLIEDNEHDRAIYSKLLYYNGYDILFAETGEIGIETATTARPDAILLDLVLPGMDGVDVCRQLRDRLGDAVPIVILSGLDRDDARAGCLEAGATAFIPKPAMPFDVLQEIRRLVGDSTPEEIAEKEAGPRRAPRQPAGGPAADGLSAEAGGVGDPPSEPTEPEDRGREGREGQREP